MAGLAPADVPRGGLAALVRLRLRSLCRLGAVRRSAGWLGCACAAGVAEPLPVWRRLTFRGCVGTARCSAVGVVRAPPQAARGTSEDLAFAPPGRGTTARPAPSDVPRDGLTALMRPGLRSIRRLGAVRCSAVASARLDVPRSAWFGPRLKPLAEHPKISPSPHLAAEHRPAWRRPTFRGMAWRRSCGWGCGASAGLAPSDVPRGGLAALVRLGLRSIRPPDAV